LYNTGEIIQNSERRVRRNFTSLKKSFVLTLLAVALIGVCSCTMMADDSPTPQSTISESPSTGTTITAPPIDESIVQVWDLNELLSTGVAIDDGSYVLAVLNFEESIPDILDIVAPSGDTYRASILAIDPRTGATLLKLDSASLPAAGMGDATSIVSEQQVIATWYQQPYIGNVLGEPELAKTDLMAERYGSDVTVSFSVHFPIGTMPDIPSVREGAIITDENGFVLGLLGIDHDTLFPHPHGIGILPTVASINAALEMLSPDYAERPYVNGPIMIVVVNELAGAYISGNFVNYVEVTEALQHTFHQVGTPLPADELPQNSYTATDNPADGNALTAVYARPVEIKNASGDVLARATWVSIQWNRSGGEPNILFYGSGHLVLEGGFQLPDDLSYLITVIDPLMYHQP
jgi:hypothetical protein